MLTRPCHCRCATHGRLGTHGQVDRELAELREFLEQKQVSKKLKDQVRAYMRVLYRRKTGESSGTATSWTTSRPVSCL